MKKLFLLLCVLAVTLSASAQNQYYVSPTGSDSNNGMSSGTPWQHCSKAISTFSLAAGGAVINFAPGNYGTVCTVNRGGSSSTARLVLKCTEQWTPGGTTGCRGLGWVISSANSVDVGALNKFGFEYTDPNAEVGVDVVWQCDQTASTCSSGNDIHVLGNYLHDIGQNVRSGCPQSGAILAPTQHGHTITGFQAIGNLIDHFGINGGSTCAEAHGIYVASANGVLENNIITRAAAAAIQYYDQACNSLVSNNDLMNSRFGLIYYGGNGCTPGLNTANNNIIANNSDSGIYTGVSSQGVCTSGRPALFSNNLFSGNGTDFHLGAAACETRQNPKSEGLAFTFAAYTGTATGDYHIRAGSQAINAGSTSCTAGGQNPCTPSVDFSNVARSSTPTIGAYEFGSPPPVAPGAPTGLTVTVH